MSEIQWIEVRAGTAWLGDNRGALMHAGNGPRHQIQIDSAFEISSEPITFAQWKNLTGQAAAGENSNSTLNRLTPLMIEAGLIGSAGNLRPPSEAEWALADSQGAIKRGPIEIEVLSDRPPRGGYWGAPCDGRPWIPPMRAGGISDHTAHVTRIWQKERTVRGATPRGVSRQKMGFRLVRAIEYEGNLVMPNAPKKSNLFLREAVIALMIGIIPSFTWAYFNASPDYISSSWLNIAFGGAFFALMTALIWRPKTPSYHIEENQMRQG